MEIQDRNSLLQMLSAVRDEKTQFTSSDANLFADILKSAKDEISFPQNDSKNIELKQSVRQIEVSEKVKSDVVGKKEKKSPKAETEDNEVSDIKEKEKQINKKDKKEDINASQDDSVSNKDETVRYEDEVTEGASENKFDNEIVEGEDVVAEDQVVISPVTVFTQSLAEMVMPEEVSSGNVTGIEQNISDTINSSMLSVNEQSENKQVASETIPQTVADDFAILSEEEKLLMEQAKYFDEKVASDKKLKIEVSVSEAKIAESLVKDVLKNRFEVDSIFQAVDETPDLSVAQEGVVFEDDAIIEKDKTVVPDIKNIAYSEVKVAQDVANMPVAKDATVIAISGKEVVAEVANVSKNEAFVKINETVSRDTFKGMSKEVIEQIKVNITKSAVKGVDTIDIQLKPEDLGKVQIKMHIAKDGKIQAEIITSRAETADMLQKDASSLSKAFNDAGYDTDAKSFTFSFQNENQAKGQEKDDAGLLKFIGESLEQEAEKVVGNDNLGYDPVMGLNIRV